MKSNKFKLHELLPLSLYNVLPEDLGWRLLDDRLLETIDTIKEKFPKGSMTINNYLWGGDRGFSGLRVKGGRWYSPTSQHTLGKAIDAIFSEYQVNEIRNYILDNPDEFPHVGGIEMGVSWLHVDVRDRVNNKIKTFYA